MAKKYEYHKRNDYPGERIDEKKRVADAKELADDRYDDRVAIDNNKLNAMEIADQEKYEERVSADNERYEEEVEKNRGGGTAFWLITASLFVIAIFAVGLWWNPWNQPTVTTIPNTQSNVANVTPAMTPTLTLTQAPSYVTAGHGTKIEWNIDGNGGTITSTAVHYGSSSVLNPNSLSSYPNVTTEQCTDSSCNIPSSFSAQLNLDKPGNYYYRVSTIIDGKQYWSDEVNVKVISDLQTPQRFMLVANSFGFYDYNLKTDSISVRSGQPVDLILYVIDDGTFGSGLQFRGCGVDTGPVLKGFENGTVKLYFVPVEDCTIKSYMIGGNVVQSSLAINTK